VLKHLSVAWLFLVSISEKRDCTTDLCVESYKYVGDVKFENLCGPFSKFSPHEYGLLVLLKEKEIKNPNFVIIF